MKINLGWVAKILVKSLITQGILSSWRVLDQKEFGNGVVIKCHYVLYTFLTSYMVDLEEYVISCEF